MFLVRTGLEFAGVAACAIGLKCGVSPCNQLRIGLVACSTGQVRPVILWLIGQCGMTIICRRPSLGRVAGITFLRGTEMARILAGSIRAVVAG